MKYVCKTLSVALVLAILLINGIGCDNQLDVVGSATNDTFESSNELVQYLLDSGFNPKMISDGGSYFTVEGDIMITKDHIREGIDRDKSIGKIFQYVGNELVSNNVSDIMLSIHSSLSSDSQGSQYHEWKGAIELAMEEWNNLTQSRLRFPEDPSGADITIYSDKSSQAPLGLQNIGEESLDGCVIAKAIFPSNGNAGAGISINLNFDFDCDKQVGEPIREQKEYTMVHELGHTVGFRHTNWCYLGEATPTHVTGTPECTPWYLTYPAPYEHDDPFSVMNGGFPDTSLYRGLSTYDVIMAETIYPCLPGQSYC